MSQEVDELGTRVTELENALAAAVKRFEGHLEFHVTAPILTPVPNLNPPASNQALFDTVTTASGSNSTASVTVNSIPSA